MNHTITLSNQKSVSSAGQMQQVDPPPSEPNLISRTEEMLGYLLTLSATLEETQYKLFIPRMPITPGNQANQGNSANTAQLSLEALIAHGCSLAASLCGAASTICSKL